MARILNLSVEPMPRSEPAAPHVQVVNVPPVGEAQHAVLFDANSLVAVETTPAAGERYRQEPSAFQGLVVGYPRRPLFDLIKAEECRQIVLRLSDDCNLACSYCRVRTANRHATMSVAMALGALKLFGNGRDWRVCFFGGEPILQMDRLTQVVAAIEKRAQGAGATLRWSITTNGTLITAEVARFLADRRFALIVSADGPCDLHNAARGEGSHQAMLRGLVQLVEAGAPSVALRGTWSEPADLVRRLNWLNAACDGGLASGVALEPADTFTYGADLDAEIHRAAEWMLERVQDGVPARWKYLQTLLWRLLWGQRKGTECGAGRGYCSVGCDGAIYACHRQPGAPIGVIKADGQILMDSAARSTWDDNRFCARQECPTCWIRHLCGGACRGESLELCGDMAVPLQTRCRLMRRLAEEALWMATQLSREELMRWIPQRGVW